jgi:hypothetical protein
LLLEGLDLVLVFGLLALEVINGSLELGLGLLHFGLLCLLSFEGGLLLYEGTP